MFKFTFLIIRHILSFIYCNYRTINCINLNDTEKHPENIILFSLTIFLAVFLELFDDLYGELPICCSLCSLELSLNVDPSGKNPLLRNKHTSV